MTVRTNVLRQHRLSPFSFSLSDLYEGVRSKCKGRDSSHTPRFSANNLTTKWTFNLRLYFICSSPHDCIFHHGWDERRSQIWCLWAGTSELSVYSRLPMDNSARSLSHKNENQQLIKNFSTCTLGFSPPDDIAATCWSAQPKTSNTVWFCKVDHICIWDHFDNSVKQKATPNCPTCEEWDVWQKRRRHDRDGEFGGGEPRPGEQDRLSYNQH